MSVETACQLAVGCIKVALNQAWIFSPTLTIFGIAGEIISTTAIDVGNIRLGIEKCINW
jgi:hypothetical protein